FRLVSNGSDGLEAVPESLLAYRYLLSPTLDQSALDSAFLRAQLQQRIQDLNSPAAGLLKPWLKRDPTLEVLQLAERWRPAQEPERAFDVWMSPDQRRALLVVETKAAGFDPRGQANAVARIERAFTTSRSTTKQTLIVSGPGAFASMMQRKTAGEASRLGAWATVAMLLLMFIAYRSPRAVLLGVLPMASAALTGMAAVGLWFGSIHGITLAFGFTLIGVAQDYPIHLFSHQHRGIDPHANARALWPTLGTGVASTCIAYLAFLFSGVTGLAQLACFSIAGLAAAALSTRYLMPHLLAGFDSGAAESQVLGRCINLIDRIPRPLWLLPLIVVGAALALLLPRAAVFENNLASLTPIPAELLRRDAELREQLAAPDVRHMLVLRDDDVDRLLARSEALIPALQTLVEAKVIQDFDLAARYLPSVATQLRRQAALPDATALQVMLEQATQGLTFRPGIFAAFVEDVQSARSATPLRASDLRGTPLAMRVDSLLLKRGDAYIAMVALSGVRNTQALATFVAAQGDGLQWLDLKATSEQLVVEYRGRVLVSLAISALLLLIVVSVSLRSPQRVARVLMPMLLSSLLVPALLHLGGVPLSLFHLIALVLAAGLGLDYALFFDHTGSTDAESSDAAQRRTLHGLLVCAASTLMVFALLATASIPVLRAIGVTVTLGVISNFVLAALFTRRPAGRVHAA
ncbi:MAG: MMPL family transporter, partial [Pseudomonadota bacterium]|nr:MMPL family transporter [Pseudomonadota bacterium]